MKFPTKTIGALLLMTMSTTSTAALIDIGGGMIYDDVLDITWLQDAGQGANLTYAGAVTYANNLNAGGFSDWRLPSMDRDGSATSDGIFDPCSNELSCRDNELAYMYYQNLGASFGTDLTGSNTPSPFTNIQTRNWSSSSDENGRIWYVNFATGQNLGSPNLVVTNISVWAVRDGGNPAGGGGSTTVPEPGTLALLGLGLAGMGMTRRRKKI